MVYHAKHDYLTDKDKLKAVIEEHKRAGSIIKEKNTEHPQIKLNFVRAENELKHAEAIFKVSSVLKLKQELELLETDTFYSGTIAHSYYSIFFGVKSLLLKEKIKTSSPNIHKATLDAFAYYFIINGKFDLELLTIYKSAAIKADYLLGLFVSEKEKRGNFTYKTLPDANKEPAYESITNATRFLSCIRKLL